MKVAKFVTQPECVLSLVFYNHSTYSEVLLKLWFCVSKLQLVKAL